MIEYRNNPDNNIVEISVAGKITEQDLDQIVSRLKTDIEKHDKLRILEEIRSFDGIDPIALWKDVRFGFGYINNFTHAAVVADAKWMRTFAEAVGSILSAEVKAFETSEIETARMWLSKS
ncbi:STAS/SEC14 domain-containing protein [Crocosphaera subtropica]|nr:STAS/SEC14 domain-containing protein [Crocosphaera subtropica]